MSDLFMQNFPRKELQFTECWMNWENKSEIMGKSVKVMNVSKVDWADARLQSAKMWPDILPFKAVSGYRSAPSWPQPDKITGQLWCGSGAKQQSLITGNQISELSLPLILAPDRWAVLPLYHIISPSHPKKKHELLIESCHLQMEPLKTSFRQNKRDVPVRTKRLDPNCVQANHGHSWLYPSAEGQQGQSFWADRQLQALCRDHRGTFWRCHRSPAKLNNLWLVLIPMLSKNVIQTHR